MSAATDKKVAIVNGVGFVVALAIVFVFVTRIVVQQSVEDNVARLQKSFPLLLEMERNDQVLLGILALRCNLKSVVGDDAKVVSCLERGLAIDSPKMPKEVGNPSLRLKRILRLRSEK